MLHRRIIRQTEGNEMELLGLAVSEYGVSFTSYFGDVYINTRTFLFVAVIVVVLRVAKLIRKSAKK